MGSPFHLINFPKRALLGIVFFCSFLIASLFGDKVTQSVIVASIEGEVSSLNLIDDFKVNMSSSYVGKKISAKTILTTGKTGKVSLLFSNGTLITIKPGSRFYLRKYKQLEAVVEDLAPPGKLEEEPTKSELSAHLDFGDLIVKAPKLKKGSSMNLSSPIGTAGIRGTMFQFMAVRNQVTGDIMGGINLVSGDIEFTDTDGNTVTILSGQSIQLATSKLGESVASQTGELVDLSSTYGPALTDDGALPPPISSIFPNLNPDGESDDEDGSGEEGSFDEPMVVGPSAGDLDFIHEIASEVFFAIGESEQVSSDFTFESIQMAPPVEAPLPEVEAPSAPAAVTGETVAGGNIDRFLGLPPELSLRDQTAAGIPNADPLFQVLSGGSRIVAELRSPDEGLTWADLDPGVSAFDFLDNDIESAVILSNVPDIVLDNPADAPGVGESVVYNVVYQVTDFRNSSTSISREVEVAATRPTIEFVPPEEEVPFTDPDHLFYDPDNQTPTSWLSRVIVKDVRGEQLSYSATPRNNSFYLTDLSGHALDPNVVIQDIEKRNSDTDFQIIAQDWRGLTTNGNQLKLKVRVQTPTEVDPIGEFLTAELSGERLTSIDPNINATDEFNNTISEDSIALIAVVGEDGSAVDPLSSIDSLSDQNYTLTYQINDSRDINSSVDRTLQIYVTAPGFEEDEISYQPFQSNPPNGWLSSYPSPAVEYTDPLNELEDWISGQKAKDFNGLDINVSVEILNDPDFDVPTKTLPVGNYQIRFTAKDPRYLSAHEDWEDDLTIVYDTSLTVVATPPEITIAYHESKIDGLSADIDEITYLVRTKDGANAIYPSASENPEFTLNVGEQSHQYIPYYVATGFEGTDITSEVVPSAIDNVDYSVVDQNFTITLSVSDSSIRNPNNDQDIQEINTTVSPTVRIVDILPPVLEVKPLSDLDLTEANNSDIHGLKGADFPDPGLIIYDNYWSQSDIEAHNGITSNESQEELVYGYPDALSQRSPDTWQGEEEFAPGTLKDFPESLFLSNLEMGKAGDYEITYSNLEDPSGNLSLEDTVLLTRDITVIDTRAPVVLFHGSEQEQHRWTSLLSGSSYYFERGVFAYEDLFHENDADDGVEDGKIDWDDGENSPWTVTIQEFQYNSSTQSWSVIGNPENNGTTPLETVVASRLQDPENIPIEPIRYDLIYSITDESGNVGEATRTIEFIESPNIDPQIQISGAELIDGNYTYTVDISQPFNKPVATASIQHGSSFIDLSDALTSQYRLLENNGNGDGNPFPSLGDQERVNFHTDGGVEYYVDENLNKILDTNTSWRKLVLEFEATDTSSGKSVQEQVEIRFIDTTEPTISLNAGDTSVEAGASFTDDGISSVVNHGGGQITVSVEMNSTDGQYSSGVFQFSSDTDTFSFENNLTNLVFTHPDDYFISYAVTDTFGNVGTVVRNVTVQDTIPPHLALIPSSGDLDFSQDNAGDPFENPINQSYLVERSLTTTYPQDTTSPHENGYIRIDPSDENHFMLKLSEVESQFDLELEDQYLGVNSDSHELEIDDIGTDPDSLNRRFLLHKAVNLTLSSSLSLVDPGVYVESRSDYPVEVWSNLKPVFKIGGALDYVWISYYAKQTSPDGTEIENQIEDARKITFIDETVPTLQISPATDGLNSFVYIEAGDSYTEQPLQSIDLLSNGLGDDHSDLTTSWYAFDTGDGNITSTSINIEDWVLVDDNSSILSDIADSGSYAESFMSGAVSAQYLDRIIRIDYNVTDSAGNVARTSRYLSIQDRTPPSIDPSSLGTVNIGYDQYDSELPDGNYSLKITNDLVVNDHNSIDTNLSYSGYPQKWDINISTNFLGKQLFPEEDSTGDPNFPGYTLAMRVKDNSGNWSDVVERVLQISDSSPPTITLIGDNPLHDFLRWRKNTTLGNDELLFEDRDENDTNPSYDSSGFSQGAHRLIYSDYSFVDPGAYVTDQFNDGNDGFFTSENYPTYLNQPTSFRIVYEDDFNSWDTCSHGPGIIHVWSDGEQGAKILDGNLSYFQDNIGSGVVALPDSEIDVNSTIPDVDGSSPPLEFDDQDKPTINTTVAMVILKYKVMDGWGNTDETTRRVYIYKSAQFTNSAFYATPINTVSSAATPVSGLYWTDPNSTNYSNSFSLMRDFDGDGVSDYWENVLGYRFDDRTDTPDMSDSSIFKTNLAPDWNTTTTDIQAGVYIP